MKSILRLVQNVATQTEAPDAVNEWLEVVWQNMETALLKIAEGNI